MKPFMNSISTFVVLFSSLAALTSAQQLQLNYYNDNYCSDYLSSLEYDWGNYLVGGGNQCFNYNYGNSVNIANCAGDFCTCFFFTEENCQGDYYTSLQDAGYDQSTQWEFNCLMNEASFASMQCFYFGTYQDTTYP